MRIIVTLPNTEVILAGEGTEGAMLWSPRLGEMLIRDWLAGGGQPRHSHSYLPVATIDGEAWSIRETVEEWARSVYPTARVEVAFEEGDKTGPDPLEAQPKTPGDLVY